jgi:hypothetical protein
MSLKLNTKIKNDQNGIIRPSSKIKKMNVCLPVKNGFFYD